MKYINSIHPSNRRRILGIFLAVFLLTSYALVVFAVAPPGGYQPGQTLDPDCNPGDSDCTVAVETLDFDSPLLKTGSTISIPAASAGVDGYLSASDWNRFEDKQDSFGSGTSFQYLRGDNTWQTLNTSVVPESGNLYWTNGRFDTRLSAATSAANLQTIGTITSGVWHGSQITDAYISDSITASNYIPLSQKGVANGVASLGSDGKVPSSQLSSFSLSDTFVVNSEVEMLALSSAELGDVAIRLDENKSYILTTNDPTNVANWQQIITPLDFVLAVNGQTGAVNLTTTDIPEGLNLYYTDARVDDYLNTQKGVANGIASLDSNGKIPSSQLGSIILNETYVVVDTAEMLALTGVANGDLAVVTSTSETYVLADDVDPSDINSWVEIVNGSPVTSVNGQVGTVSLTTTNIAEGSNQYFTNARARGALSATGPLTYNSSTGVVGITQSNAITNGYLSAVDWNTFNDKQDALTFGTVTATSNPEITITGGTGAVIGSGLDITIPDASDSVRGLITTGTQNLAGIKTFADGIGVGDASPSTLFSVGLGGLFQVDNNGDLVKIKNISYTWPSAQGSADSVLVNDGSGGLTWASNGLVSLNGITEATQLFATSSDGSDFSITSTGDTHTFNFPTASDSARGALSATKYTEFNDKPFVDTTYNNISTLSLSGGSVIDGAGGGINNIMFGYQAGDAITTGNNNALLGYQSGKNISTGVAHSFFAGYQSGLSATSATNSIFIGRQAGSGATSASFANFQGRSAGINATGAQYSIFVGDNAGNTASGSSNATFIGQNAGYQATTAPYSTFIGTSAGYQASGTTTANFIGYAAGYAASDADYSNMIGRGAGNAAANAQYSNFLGFQAGYNANNAANSIFIGKNAGNSDLVNNTVSGSSIAIGDSAGTGGFSNSIALGASAVNTSANQLLIGSSYTKLNVRGVDYTWPSAQAAGSGYNLTNDGSGNLSWVAAISVGGSSGDLQYNNAGALGGISGVTFDGTNFDAKDNVFRIVDNSDTTKRAIFEVSGIDAGTTRTFTLPNAAGTLALTSDLSSYLKSSIGISGGTTLVGGTASGENLTLSSTSNATKGKILFGTSAYDEVNNRLGLGTTSPLTGIHVAGTNADVNIAYLSTRDVVSSTNMRGSGMFHAYTGGGVAQGDMLAFGVAGDWASVAQAYTNPGLIAQAKMVVAANGNVGIGTTAPNSRLHVHGGDINTPGITFSNNNTQPTWLVMTMNGQYGTIAGVASGTNSLMSGSSQYDTILRAEGRNLHIGTGYSAHTMTINSTGVGIGTMSPSYKLHVVSATSGAFFDNSNSASTPSAYFIGSNDHNIRIGSSTGYANYYNISRSDGDGLLYFRGTQAGFTGYYFKNNDGSKYFTLSTAGRFGINVASPSANLHLPAGTATASNAPLKFTSGTNLTTAEAGAMEYNGTSLFFTPASTRYNILMNNYGLSGGQTIVGGTAASDTLTLSSTSNATKGKILFGTSAYDEANNRLGVGTTSPSYALGVSDAATAGIVGSFTNSDGTCTLDPGDVSGWSCPSDLNLKKDINTLTSGSLDNLLALRPVTYRLRNEDSSVNLSTGLIAQEVQTIFPTLVKTQIDGTLALNYGGLTPYMIAAIQEMNLRITEINNIEQQNSWRDALIAWFANTANGITEFFSKKVSTEELCVKDSAGQTCITRSQLDTLLNGQGIMPQTPSPAPEPTPDPDPTPDPETNTDNPDVIPDDSVPEPDPGTTQEPDQEPTVVLEPDPVPAPSPEPEPSPSPESSDPVVIE